MAISYQHQAVLLFRMNPLSDRASERSSFSNIWQGSQRIVALCPLEDIKHPASLQKHLFAVPKVIFRTTSRPLMVPSFSNSRKEDAPQGELWGKPSLTAVCTETFWLWLALQVPVAYKCQTENLAWAFVKLVTLL